MSDTNVTLVNKIMRSVRRENTAPELRVRKAMHALGLRFRIHRHDLPGTPDIVLSKYKTAIFVHGCFWHRHEGCRYATEPKTRLEFWREKFSKNVERDERKTSALADLGWRVLVIWECETKNKVTLDKRIKKYFFLD